MNAIAPRLRPFAAVLLCLYLTACGGGGGGGGDFGTFAVGETPASPPPVETPAPAPPAPPVETAPPPTLYAIGGTVKGLADNEKLTLLNNGGDALTITANGTFRFATGLPTNTTHTVTMGTQPLWQNCTVDSGSGTTTVDVTQVTVTCIAAQAQVSTLAGTYGEWGTADGTGKDARFSRPAGIASDRHGNLYVAAQFGYVILKIDPAGVVTTLAGSGAQGSADGNGRNASFIFPRGVAVDTDGNVYVADGGNNKIRKITPSGEVTTLAGIGTPGTADGPRLEASFRSPESVAVDTVGNVYVADTGNHKIRKITPSGEVTTLAGSGTRGTADGPPRDASFDTPFGVAVDTNGDVYVADTVNNKIRKITPSGEVTTLAGSGARGAVDDDTGLNASFQSPTGLVVDAAGNVYVADMANNLIRKITPNGRVTTLAGSLTAGPAADGIGAGARFAYPYHVTVNTSGNLYVTDYVGPTVRKITPVR